MPGQGPTRKRGLSVANLLLYAVMLGGTLPTAGLALPHDSKHDARHMVEDLEEQWRSAMLTNNINALDKLMADDFMAITANGTFETKGQLLASHRAKTVMITKYEIDNLKVRVYGKTAVVTSKAEIMGANGDSEITGRYLYTRVYNCDKLGQWKIVSFEASRIRDPYDRSSSHK